MTSAASRDAGLRRLSQGTSLLAAGSFLAVGLATVAVAKAHPGKSSHHAVVTAPVPDDGGGGPGGFVAPGQAPGPSAGAPQAQSGAS